LTTYNVSIIATRNISPIESGTKKKWKIVVAAYCIRAKSRTSIIIASNLLNFFHSHSSKQLDDKNIPTIIYSLYLLESCVEKMSIYRVFMFLERIEKIWKKQTKEYSFSKELFIFKFVKGKKGIMRDENNTIQYSL